MCYLCKDEYTQWIKKYPNQRKQLELFRKYIHKTQTPPTNMFDSIDDFLKNITTATHKTSKYSTRRTLRRLVEYIEEVEQIKIPGEDIPTYRMTKNGATRVN